MVFTFRSYRILPFFVVPLLVLGGCAAVDLYPAARPVDLTPAEAARLGSAVEKRLVQILGGHYHDQAITADLQRLGEGFGCKLSLVDRSSEELYPLPGQRAVVTRGLLTRLHSRAQLEKLLRLSAYLAQNAYAHNASRAMTRATTEFLSGERTGYNPGAPDIRLAEMYADKPCAGFCLDEVFREASAGALPDSFESLQARLPGFDLLASGQQQEKAGDQAGAISTYLQAAFVTPDEPRILSVLGMAYLRAGQPQSARLHLKKAAMLQPAYYRTQMGLGYLYLQLGDIDRANQALAESVSLLPVTENLFLLAEAREKNGDMKSAMLLYRMVVENDRYGKLGRTAAARLKQARDK